MDIIFIFSMPTKHLWKTGIPYAFNAVTYIAHFSGLFFAIALVTQSLTVLTITSPTAKNNWCNFVSHSEFTNSSSTGAVADVIMLDIVRVRSNAANHLIVNWLNVNKFLAPTHSTELPYQAHLCIGNEPNGTN